MIDFVSSIMWCYFPWRWTITNISPQTPLVDGNQDYTAPTNIYRLTRTRIIRTDTTPSQALDPLTITEQLEPEYNKVSIYGIRRISLDYPTGLLRLDAPPQISTGMTVVLDGDYQTAPTKITSANMGSLNVWFPDQYAPVMVEGVKWYLYKLTDDPRAGTVVTEPRTGRRTYTGQLGEFLAALSAMGDDEDFGNAAPFFWPSTPLGAGRYGYRWTQII